MSAAEVLVWGIQDTKQLPCILEVEENSNKTDSFICEIRGVQNTNIKQIKVGDF